MIKGAMILAVGFSLGYAKALHEQDDIRAGMAEMIELLKNATAETTKDPVVNSTATEDPDNEILEGELDDPRR